MFYNETRASHFSWIVSLLALLFLSLNAVPAQENVQVTEQGVVIKMGHAQIELTPATSEALRMSVSYSGKAEFSQSCFLANSSKSNSVAWQLVRHDGFVGIRTKAGELLVDPQADQWMLENAHHEVLISKYGIGNLDLTNGSGSPRVNVTLGRDKTKPFGVYGSGNGNPVLLQTKIETRVANGIAVIPYYWSPAGYAVLAVSANDNLPANWTLSTNGECVTWNFPGTTADLYLMPAPTLRDAASAYSQLAGRAPVPPRWTLGYLQSRWGWKDRDYIEDTLKQFHDRKIPVDAFIYDFEWYTTKPDYELPPEGAANFGDFGWNANLFPDPAQQIKAYKDEGIHFVGIRKPRLGNTANLAMIRERGWDLRGKGATRTSKFQSRDVDFANPQFRTWYIDQSTNLLAQGVDGWWNDEGEGSFTTYYYWNLAEADALAQVNPGHRLWTLNRAFSPGMQRLGAGAWTGDIRSTWRSLAETPTSLLNWSLAGMPYTACDIGGFEGDSDPSPEMLSRWMEAGVFFPIMRAHSAISRTPHFPWLFGPDAENAIRKAIDLRYRLIPFYYSLAHQTYETGVPIMRPLIMEFPNDPNVANLSDQWLMGSSLMAAPVLQPDGKRSVYLPAGTWYVFGTNTTLEGNRTIQVTASLDEIPLYVRAGSILPLGPVIQHTAELPGGPLELQIYPGIDATFTLVEDDGETTGYLTGKMRRTTFAWNEAAGRLSWKTKGTYDGKDIYKSLRVIVFDRKGKIRIETPLDLTGSLLIPLTEHTAANAY